MKNYYKLQLLTLYTRYTAVPSSLARFLGAQARKALAERTAAAALLPSIFSLGRRSEVARTLICPSRRSSC
jgi:hypothetical protein